MPDLLSTFISERDRLWNQATSPLNYQEKVTGYLTHFCSIGGECDPLVSWEDANNAYGNAAKPLEKQGFYSSAEAVLLYGWNSFGEMQVTQRRRIYRGGIGMYLTLLYLGRYDHGAALWWALHTQADDILGRHSERGGEGKTTLRTVLGMSQVALEKFNAIADNNVEKIERANDKWSLADGFAEDVVVRFALSYPEFAYLFGNDTASVEFPLSNAYFKASLARIDTARHETENRDKTSTERGNDLEHIAAYLFLLLAGWVPRQKVTAEDSSSEHDLVVRNFNKRGTITTDLLDRHIIIECKNWEGRVNPQAVGYFLHRIHLAHAKLGVILTKSGITGDNERDEEYARGLIRRTFHEDGIICIDLNRNHFDLLAEGHRTSWSLLTEGIERIRFGIT